MIPKVIHYCWFGEAKKPRMAKKCIRSWKKYCPDYQIIEWNETNYDISAAPLFVQQAIEAKKWAFAVDYIRYDVVYKYGGIYFDTDVQVLKKLDFLLKDKAFFGMQFNNVVASGLGFGSEAGAPILRDLMNSYLDAPFFLPDGKYDTTPCPKRDKPVFEKYGYSLGGTEQIIDGGIHIYPKDYFCPLSWKNRKMRKTANTVSVHWFAASWYTKAQRKEYILKIRRDKRDSFNRSSKDCVKKILGSRNYTRLKHLLKRNR